jgi:pimeloyl-ACP methyl ester carboxylesterase
LVLHGEQDKALHARGHSNTWEWIDAEMTLVMFPEAGHFIQADVPDRVNQILYDWLQWHPVD